MKRWPKMLGVRGAIDLRNAPFEQHHGLLAPAGCAVSPRVECDGVSQPSGSTGKR
jgi:hypothetical protein